MDGQRQQYIPGPPTLPPPPPRHPPTQLQSVVPPPPPGPPPGASGYGVQPGWQQNWLRQNMTPAGYPPPPPFPQPQHLHYRPGQLSIVPPREPQSQSMVGPTYIPGADTLDGFPSYDSHTATLGSQTYEHRGTDGNYNPQTPSGRNPPSLALHNNIHELVSNDHPPQQAASQTTDLTKAQSHRHNPSGASLGGLSPSEAAIQWPLDRVLLWLARNGFSRDWQETFKSLELQGSDFLELGLASGGRGNLGKIHKVVYPQLAKECAQNGTAFDSAREREEGLRLRKLIRQFHDSAFDSNISTPMRGEPPNLMPSETGTGTSTGPYSNQILEPRSAGPYTGQTDLTADQLSLLQSSGQNQNSQMRSVTMPVNAVHTDRDSSYDSPSRESPTWLRSDYSRNAFASIEYRRQSPSMSSESGVNMAGSSLRPQDSPKSGSPALQYASSSYVGLTSSSTGDLTLRQDHSRGNSTDSIPGIGRGYTPRYYDNRRQGPEGVRPSPQDNIHGRPWSGENSSYSKDHSKGLLGFWKKKTKANDLNHYSPEDPDSPPSPESRNHGQYLPYIKPGFNSSDLSLGERPSSSSATKPKKWVFTTMDGLNYRLIDITDMDNVETLRVGICKALGLSDWTNAQIFLTEPGLTNHEDPLNDTNLELCRRRRSDAYGSLKFFVQATPIRPLRLQLSKVDGLGLSMPTEKLAPSPTSTHTPIHRKPLDEDALSRISPQTQTKPGSPLLSSWQPNFKVPTPKLLSDNIQDFDQPMDLEKTDLVLRHEAHLRDIERKQRENGITRIPPTTQQNRKDYGETGYRREGVIDFDSPRISPYEEKKPEALVPLRKPPAAPNESNTLTKVNSLRKSTGHRADRHAPQLPSVAQTHGLGAVLASVGRISSAIGAPAPSVQVPSMPSSTITQEDHGSDSERTNNTMGSALTVFSKTTADSPNPDIQGSTKSPAWSATPNSATDSAPFQKPSLQSRKSYGPEFDFEENQVSFERNLQPADDSDGESSDDGLFAMPLANKQAQTPDSTSQTKAEKEKPQISVNTNDRNRKRRTVNFESPIRTVHEGFSAQSPYSPAEASDSPISPKDDRTSKRKSFVNADVWASRPPVEGVIDNLDSFFPDVDLDAPYLDEPPSPISKDVAPLKFKAEASYPFSKPGFDPSAIYGTDAGTTRPHEGAGVVARHMIDRSGGGLSRKKSIREVARGAAHRTKSVNGPVGPQRSGDLLRRKSTKMFGAKIMQIRPRPGSRLSQLEPIPQNVPQSGSSVPQRQPTFRIIRGQLIGKGTFGRVYLGMNADNGEVLAVKQVEINPRIAGTDRDRIKEMVAALDIEIDTMQHLEHPNIVQYLGCERGELSISIYLEYISGGSVGSCLRKHGKFQESVVQSLTHQTLGGLAYLHDMGILHRDLKADNILLDVDGTCKISDFGISKKTDDIYGNDSSNSMQGSVFWMAPEVIQSQGQGYSAKVDIWSLGCVVLEMFAGRRPWSKEEAIGAIFKLGSLGQAPPIPEDVSMNISPAALAFMWDCFTVNSAERPTAGTLLTRHPFCTPDPTYNFLDTELYAKIR
ncbi:hypothetical protein N7495_007987 [Penicillium taxi]|uniref:uncharacterized protein n=1 Tax=Penicillium taxi TaxID=168475 RepID=UPI0025450B54|nr:uncharacterized protein N7495_007987 [Penicillium taxi]KAJ5887946.1 hypothetical protein N7495_007987 [Penicillium taxi]